MLEGKIKLYENERLLFMIRPSLRFYRLKFFILFFLILIPVFFWFFLIKQGFYGYAIIVCSFLLAIFYLTQILIIYYYNVYIITNSRLIGIEQKGFFKKVIMVTEIKYFKNVEAAEKNSLNIEMIDGRNLFLNNIADEDIEYICETINSIIEERKSNNKSVSFMSREL